VVSPSIRTSGLDQLSVNAKARMEHHRVELERAWRDYYGVSHNVRIVHQASPAGLVVEEEGFQPHLATSIFMICAGGGNVVG